MSSEWRNPPGAGPTMRIMCPNCGAQYEVEDALIPEAGRDVQCSNCGKGWFQPKHPEPADGESLEEIAGADADDVEPVDEEVTAQEEPARSEETEQAEETAPAAIDGDDLSDETEKEPRAEAEPQDPEEDAEPFEPPAATLAPRKTDENVLAVLREEAEREIAQRRNEAEAIESQPELGLTEPSERKSVPMPAKAAAAGAVSSGARRDLLPDIDEINSTLRSDADRGAFERGESGDSAVGERRRGFRLGFGLMMLLAAGLIGLYLASGWLAATFPALEPVLIAYVNWANGLAAWLDGLLAAGVDGLSALTVGIAPEV